MVFVDVSRVVVTLRFAFLHLFEALGGDVREVLWEPDCLSSEVGDESKCCDWSMQDCAVEFANDVGTAIVAFYDYERSKISRAHLAIKGLVESCVTHENQGSSSEVEVLDCRLVVFLEAKGILSSGFHDSRVKLL